MSDRNNRPRRLQTASSADCFPLFSSCRSPLSEERAFYKAVEEKMTLTMNAFLKAGTAMSNYTSVLILLLVSWQS